MIPVVKPFLPEREAYQKYIDGVWSRNWLTNNGPLVNELELTLKKYLKIKNMLFLSNGTIALQIAIKALGIKGEIITTPFSYVATTSSIVWENCTPVFVDIDKGSWNIDPQRIEDAITKKTSAILATHVFGNPCELETIEEIATRKKIKVIYDAAHAFGVSYKGRSVFEYGDISTTSFHATKLFHTVEGGGVFTKEPDVLKRMAYMRNFGHDGPEKFNGVGINGKNSEFHAAMGLCNLKHIEEILARRKELSLYYNERLKNLDVQRPKLYDKQNYNYAYYPILFPTEKALKTSVERLVKAEIFLRRYFYPALSSLDYVTSGSTPLADFISKRVACLPLYHSLSKEEIDLIARLLLRVQNN